jgi:hypothetical protein
MNDQQKLKQIEDTLATGNIDVSAVATLIGMEPHRVKDALEKLAPYAQGPEKNAKILDEMLSEIERAIKKADSSQFNEISPDHLAAIESVLQALKADSEASGYSSDALEKTSRLTSRIKGKL